MISQARAKLKNNISLLIQSDCINNLQKIIRLKLMRLKKYFVSKSHPKRTVSAIRTLFSCLKPLIINQKISTLALISHQIKLLWENMLGDMAYFIVKMGRKMTKGSRFKMIVF